jgi:hypothetical protein
VAVAFAWGAYTVLGPGARDGVNHVASVTGLSIVPWPEKARTAATSMYDHQGSTLAESILNSTHPTGKGAQLSNYSAAVEGDELISKFDVSWKGGLLGAAYVTTIEWRCSQASSGSVRIVSDTAAIPVAPPFAKQLEAYFASSVYPVLRSSAN